MMTSRKSCRLRSTEHSADGSKPAYLRTSSPPSSYSSSSSSNSPSSSSSTKYFILFSILMITTTLMMTQSVDCRVLDEDQNNQSIPDDGDHHQQPPQQQHELKQEDHHQEQPPHQNHHHHHHHHRPHIRRHHRRSSHYQYEEYKAQRQQPQSNKFDLTNYLQTFGYLPGSDVETQALRTQSEFENAIKKFQKFAHIEVTGILDEQTKEMMQKSRCGVADIIHDGAPQSLSSSDGGSDDTSPSSYQFGPTKWEKTWLTYRFLGYSRDLERSDQEEAIRDAFNVWAEKTPLKFREMASGNADILIKFVRGGHDDGYPFDGNGGTLAHAFFPGQDRGGDVHFDEDEYWTVRTDNGTNLFIVAAHELGHSLGLAHSGTWGALMYPWYQGYTPNFELSYDDIYAIQTLYGGKPRDPNQTTKRTTTTTTTKKPTTKKSLITTTTTRPTTTTTDEHQRHHDEEHWKKAKTACKMTFDAIALIRGELFFFTDNIFFRFNKHGKLIDSGTETKSFWTGLPSSKVDAVVETKSNSKIIFFIGNRYWVLFGNTRDGNFPEQGEPLTMMGISPEITHIDAAFVWSYNKKTYLISGYQYWRLNETTRKVEYGYPRDISLWEGVKVPVDAAFTDSGFNKTYFVHGHDYWEFNDMRMRVRHETPHNINQRWFKCPLEYVKQNEYPKSDVVKVFGDGSVNINDLYNSPHKSGFRTQAPPLFLINAVFAIAVFVHK